MKNNKKRFLSTIQLCTVVLFFVCIAVAVEAQTPASISRIVRSNARASLYSLPRSWFSFLPSGFRAMPVTRTCATIAKSTAKELQRAWHYSGNGTTGHEGVVLIFRMVDGSFLGKLQRFTSEYKCASFIWSPAAQAIVHTHPNGTDPEPSEQDKFIADKYGVPNFTISNKGMYVYNPLTKMTSKVLNDLEWLDPANLSRWIQEIGRNWDSPCLEVPESDSR
jgi:hypothetical protein